MIGAQDLFLPLLVGLTSVAAYAVGRGWLALPRTHLGRALSFVLDVLGWTIIFFAANAVVGVTILLGLRHVVGRPVSLHVLDDVALAVLSMLQAVVFAFWRRTSDPGDG